jgi:hypothetical protein
MRAFWPLFPVVTLACWVVASAQTVQFNRDVRPILSDKCYTCHGPDPAKRKTQMRLDAEAASAMSAQILMRVTSTNKAVHMPPAYAGVDGLTDAQIETLRQWVEQGAKWEAHWSFIPPRRPDQPTSIDALVQARLQREGLQPSTAADRATLLRRVTLDLTGLPPTLAELASKESYEQAVDRLLASPRYGERMAVRWLDAARYADTNGYQSDGERSMWRWRDWVIAAFNRNLPFDQFTIEQIAGDLLPNPTLSQKIATGFHRNHRTNAEGGIVPEEFRVEYVADRVETTSTVWLGITMGCARCHDHKYDPMKQRDFYRMFAFFNNVPEKGLVYNFGNDEPMIKAPTDDQLARLAALDARVAATTQTWNAVLPSLAVAQTKWERKIAHKHLDWSPYDGLIIDRGEPAILDTKIANFNYLDPFTLSAWINPSAPDGAIMSRAEDYFEGEGYGLYLLDGKIRLHIIKRWTDIGLRIETERPVPLNQWTHVSATYDGYRYASGVKIFVNGQEQKLKVLFDELNYPLGVKEPFRIGEGGGPKLRFKGSLRGIKVFNRAITLDEARTLPIEQSISELAAIPASNRSQAQADKLRLCFLDKFPHRELAELTQAQVERKRFYESIPTVMVMQESPDPRPAFILKRGAYDAPGEKVDAGVPGFLPALPKGAPNNRLGLAGWLVSPENPLTARVIVNRFWEMYFGTGLVKTVEDFGSQGEAPANVELLDWLATEFVQSGWNVKALQKTIVMSATYRQSSRITPELLQRDPENRLLARGPRFRLPSEMIRDQALAVSGLLVEKIGGPSVKPYQPPGLWQELAGGKGYKADHGEGLYRRSLYTYWKRTVAPPSMVTFDSPTRESCTVREVRTNTPLQALDLMDDVAYVEAARKLAERMMLEGGQVAASRIDFGYRLLLARSPKAREAEVMASTLDRFVRRYKADRESALAFISEGESARNAGLGVPELAAYAQLASLLLNLDETVTKE